MRRRIALLLWLVPALARAQGGTGDLHGTVTDEPGRPLADATVRVEGEGPTVETRTGANGRYRVLYLRPGTYTLTVSRKGYADVRRRSVRVALGRSVDVPVFLKKSGEEETITVVEDPRMIDPRRPGPAATFAREELERVPVGRQPSALLAHVPGTFLNQSEAAGAAAGAPPLFAVHGVRPQDGTWTLDGVDITDRRPPFAAPASIDMESLAEAQVAAAGQGIRHGSGGAAVHLALPHADEDVQGAAHGFTRALGGTPEGRDHIDRAWDIGIHLGGPLVKDRLWGWAGWARQRTRAARGPEEREEETTLTQAAARLDWQPATGHHLAALWHRGTREGFGFGTGLCAGCIDAPTATWRRDEHGDGLPGLLKLESMHRFGRALFIQARYARFARSFDLLPAGGPDQQAGISPFLGRTFGSTVQLGNRRRQHSGAFDLGADFVAGGFGHDLLLGASYVRDDEEQRSQWPGDQIVGFDGGPEDRRARHEEFPGHSRDRVHHASFYVEDRLTRERLMLGLGLRYDRQWGQSLALLAHPGYRTPFTWSDLSPRLTATLMLDAVRRSLVRAGLGRYVGRLSADEVGHANPLTGKSFLDRPWRDDNGDHFVQPLEVRLGIVGIGGFDDVIDESYRAPSAYEFVLGFDREVKLGLFASLSYVHRRNTRLPAEPQQQPDYQPGPVLQGTLPDGTPYAVPTLGEGSRVVGSGRLLTNREGYRQVFHGWQLAVLRRFSKGWGLRLSASYDDWEERFRDAPVPYFGNPTPLDTDPLVDGGKVALRTGVGGAGDDVFIGGHWTLSASGAFELPADVEVAGTLVARHGSAFPVFHQASLGFSSWRVLVSPEVDTFRLDDTWTLDLRLSRTFKAKDVRVTALADVFNVLDNDTVLERYRNAASPAFDQPTRWMLPRMLRLGLRVGF